MSVLAHEQAQLSQMEDEFTELIVLTKEAVGGGGVIGDYIRPSVRFAASVNLKTGEYSETDGRIEWFIVKEGHDDWGYNFKQFGIYRLKVRKYKPVELNKNQSEVMNNSYYVFEILEENCAEPRLEVLQDHFMKPIEVKTTYGTFVLDRQFSWFKQKGEYFSRHLSITVETDNENGESAEKGFVSYESFMNDFEEWDKKIREYAASELTELANDWADEEDHENEETDGITEEMFSQKIEMCELCIEQDGNFTLYYSDGDLFYGHSIEIIGNINGDFESADICG